MRTPATSSAASIRSTRTAAPPTTSVASRSTTRVTTGSNVSYRLEHDFAGNNNSVIGSGNSAGRLLDAYLTVSFTEEVYLRAGQFRAQVLRESLIDSGALMFVDRTPLAALFAQQLTAPTVVAGSDGNDRRYASGMVIIFTQIFPCRLKVQHQRNVVTEVLPVLIVQAHAEMVGDRLHVDGRVGGAADCTVNDDGVFKGLTLCPSCCSSPARARRTPRYRYIPRSSACRRTALFSRAT